MVVQPGFTQKKDGLPVGKILGFVLLFGLANVLALIVALYGAKIDWKAPVITAIALALFAAFVAGRRMWDKIFYFWILLFALGYRTAHLTSNLSIHPLEIIIWLLFFSLLAYRMHERKWQNPILPTVAWFFVAFFPIGFLHALQTRVRPDLDIAALLPMLVVVPVFALTNELVNSSNKFRTIGGLLAVIAFYIAFLGDLEYYFPSAVAPFQGFFSDAIETITVEGFARAGFSFWGSPVVALLLALLLPLVLVQFYWWKRFEARLFLTLTVVLTLLGMYVSGYRSIWLLGLGEMYLYFLLKGSGKWLGLMVAGTAFVLTSLPLVAQERLNNFLTYGFNADSSAQKRAERIVIAWQQFLRSPLIGNGFGSTGWVHSDLLQIADMLGAIAFLLFMIWLGYHFLQVLTLYRAKSRVEPWVWETSVGLLVFLVGFVYVLSIEASIVLPQLIIPMWMILALCGVLSRIAKLPAVRYNSS